MKIFTLSLMLILTSCSLWPERSNAPLEPPPAVKAKMKADLQSAWVLFTQAKFQESFERFKSFQQTYPQTIFDVESRFGEARSLQAMGKLTEAIQIYREIANAQQSSQPQWVALALYYQSDVAEALGLETEMMASLQDCEKKESFLPDEMRKASLPARMASAYARLGQKEEAQRYREKAERGLTQLRAQGLSQEKWAQLYWAMGTFSSDQLAPENFQTHLDSFSEVQIFLLKAVEAGVSPWSDLASASIQKHLEGFWRMALNVPLNNSLDAGARSRMRAEIQRRWFGEMLVLIQNFRNYQRPESSQRFEQEKNLFAYLDQKYADLEKKIQNLDLVLPMTAEAKKRQGLKKEGQIISEPLFPVEKKQDQNEKPRQQDPKDPNLKGDHQ